MMISPSNGGVASGLVLVYGREWFRLPVGFDVARLRADIAAALAAGGGLVDFAAVGSRLPGLVSQHSMLVSGAVPIEIVPESSLPVSKQDPSGRER
jgi:hypothetical protein